MVENESEAPFVVSWLDGRPGVVNRVVDGERRDRDRNGVNG